MSKVKSDVYDGSSIKQLPFPENVRLRHQMYIGVANAKGISTCLREIVNNSVDEYLAGYATQVTIVLHTVDYRSFSVIDNGRGVPFDQHDSGKNSLEVIFGELHAGRNFEAKTVYSTGINGVGSSCVNALSSSFNVTSRRNKEYAVISFTKGILSSKVKLATITNPSEINIKTKTGTCVFFKIDDSIFNNENLAYDDIYKYAQEVAFLCPGLKITLIDNNKLKTGDATVEFLCDPNEGLKDYYQNYLKLSSITPLQETPIVFSGLIEDTKVDIVFGYSNSKNENIVSFCNTIRTSGGGSHVTGFKRALTQNFGKYIKENNLSKIELDAEDYRNGLVALISVYSFNPEYTSQTKQELDMNKLQGHVIKICNEHLKEWLSANPKQMKKLVELFILNAKGRLAQKRALENVQRESATLFASISDVRKFSDCTYHGEDSELIICEGASAKGPCDEGRDKDYQAVYALKGKPLNTETSEMHTILKNKEIEDLIGILKCGYGDNFNSEKLRFGKIIILSDSDSDGEKCIYDCRR